MRPWRKLAAAVDGFNEWIGRGVEWLALVMVLIGAYNALARYTTRFTDLALASNALYELQWYLFSLIFLLGAAYGLNHDVHVRVDVLYGRLSARGKAVIDLLGSVLFLLPFCVLMLWVSFPAVRNSWSIGEVSPDPGGLPRYPIKAVILVSFALLLLQGLSQILKQVVILRTGRPLSEIEGWSELATGDGLTSAEVAGTRGAGGEAALEGPAGRKTGQAPRKEPDTRHGEGL